ncbi:rhodanese-like domain-containing protein [Neptunitalea lumnitzerae]|uniref:Rhodanese domain-containing protein n=1 Tax=Neptunitalea lumnitzerae TaxID=2965509 RepID=A0ABQ5MHV5_9FLAO|nr:rhodanese-like domain-containing protein [Neptunitalea sp. Y10]GLB48620.1 hypothetical protein Y10_09880 [Neptunitalea sp. Y10]
MKLGTLLSVFCVLVVTSCSSYYQEHVVLLEPKEFTEKTADTSTQLIDVRTAKEFQEGAIPGAINIDLNDDHFNQKINKLDKSKPVYVYCRTGVRSKEAAILIAEVGFDSVYELSGGYKGWKHKNTDN